MRLNHVKALILFMIAVFSDYYSFVINQLDLDIKEKRYELLNFLSCKLLTRFFLYRAKQTVD